MKYFDVSLIFGGNSSTSFMQPRFLPIKKKKKSNNNVN